MITMKLKLLLYLLAKLIIRASKKNDLIKKMTASKKVVFQIKTENGKTARHFILNQGEFQSAPTTHNAPDFSIIFADDKYGFSVLTSKDKKAFLNGILEKKIKIEGDFSLVIWFQNLIGLLKKKRSPITTGLNAIGFVGAWKKACNPSR